MPGENIGNHFNFYYVGSDGEWHPIGKSVEINAADLVLSEEAEAMAWAFFEGIEIVKRSDAE